MWKCTCVGNENCAELAKCAESAEMPFFSKSQIHKICVYKKSISSVENASNDLKISVNVSFI